MPLPTDVNGSNNGRDKAGKFTPGNKFAKGNPANRKVQVLREEMLRAITPEDIREVIASLIAQAKAGDLDAIREFLNRAVGKADSFTSLVTVEVIQRELAEIRETLESSNETPLYPSRWGR